MNMEIKDISRIKKIGGLILLIIFLLSAGACSNSSGPGAVSGPEEDYDFKIVENGAEFQAALQDSHIKRIILADDIRRSSEVDGSADGYGSDYDDESDDGAADGDLTYNGDVTSKNGDVKYKAARDVRIEGKGYQVEGDLVLGNGSSTIKIEIENLRVAGTLYVDVTASGEVEVADSSLKNVQIDSAGSQPGSGGFFLNNSEAVSINLTADADNAMVKLGGSLVDSIIVNARGVFLEINSQSRVDRLTANETPEIRGSSFIQKIEGEFEKAPVEQIAYYDLSAGYNSISVPELNGDEYVYTILFSRDDSGAKHAAGSFLTAFAGEDGSGEAGNGSSGGAGDDSGSSSKSAGDLSDLSAGSLSADDESLDYLKKLEQETLAKHDEVTAETRSKAGVLEKKPEYEIGDRVDFWVRSERDVADYFVEKELELRNKSEKALIWAGDSADISDQEIDFLLAEFEGYRDDIKDYFGSEPESGEFPILQTADSRVNIVLASFEPGGYYNSADLYSSEGYRYSNEGKFVYADPTSTTRKELLAGIIAHEYQHMLYYNEKVLSGRSGYNLWINEGFSELAMDIAGFGYQQGVRTGGVNSFARRPAETSLVNWGSRLADYGASYMFARYLYDRFGKGIIREISTSSRAPKEAIAGYAGKDFNEVFQDWAIALLAGSGGLDVDERYSFSSSISVPEMAIEVINSGDRVNNEDIVGRGMMFARIAVGSPGELLIEIDNLSSSGDFRKIVVREGEN